MILDATQNYTAPLSKARLFDWHAALFPTGRSGMTKIRVGAWRDDTSGPMQVVSGPWGASAFTMRRRRPTGSTATCAPSSAGSTSPTPSTRSCGRLSPIFGSSPSIHSTTAMGASPAPLPTWRWHGPKPARSVSTACRRKSGSSARPTTHSGNHAEGRSGYHDWIAWFLGCLDRAVRWRGGQPGRGAGQGAVLAAVCGCAPAWPPASGDEQAAGRVRGQTHVVEICQACQVLAGHCGPATLTN